MAKQLGPCSVVTCGPPLYRRQMLKVARLLSQHDIDEIIYLSEDFLSTSEVEETVASSAGTALMRCLQKHEKIGPQNYAYLITCLQEIGRLDLVALLTSQSHTAIPYLPPNFSIPHQMKLRKISSLRGKQQRYAHHMQQMIHLAQEQSGSAWKKLFEILCFCLDGFQPPSTTENVSSIVGETLQNVHKGTAALINAIKNLEKKNYCGIKPNLQGIVQHSQQLYNHLDAISWLKPQHLKLLESDTVKLQPIVDIASEGCSSLCDILTELLGESTVMDEKSKLYEVLLGLEFLTTTCQHEFIMICWIVALIQSASSQSLCLGLQEHSSHIESTVQLLRKEGFQFRGDVILQLLQGTSVGKIINKEMLFPQKCNPMSVSAVVQDCPILITLYLSMFVLENRSKLSQHDWCQIKANIRLNDNTFAAMYANVVKIIFQVITNDLDCFKEEMLKSALKRTPGLQELVFELFQINSFVIVFSKFYFQFCREQEFFHIGYFPFVASFVQGFSLFTFIILPRGKHANTQEGALRNSKGVKQTNILYL